MELQRIVNTCAGPVRCFHPELERRNSLHDPQKRFRNTKVYILHRTLKAARGSQAFSEKMQENKKSSLSKRTYPIKLEH